MKTYDVVCAGAAYFDTISLSVAVSPSGRATIATDQTKGSCGQALSAAIGLARVGLRVAFCGVVGDDERGVLVREILQAEGVDTAALRTLPGLATSRYAVDLGPAAKRRSHRPRYPAPRTEDLREVRGRWLHVDSVGYPPAMAAQTIHTPAERAWMSVDATEPVPALSLAGVNLFVATAPVLTQRYDARSVPAAVTSAAAEATGTWTVTTDRSCGWVTQSGKAARCDLDREISPRVRTMLPAATLAEVIQGWDAASALRIACTTTAGRMLDALQLPSASTRVAIHV
ncbi:carbohydrate kinase family protein [Phytohabitans sp. ZYX-F-186]|uniref:Carbohydrate kinase family protein n=1 Tax=Phytohabitans maris TaxID=3071409 RepID=A0ABU0ZC47_9ACTN|nr:carbohydrate kinase family protein [Phytohabitans sp. ZYX-F-186]MDQ7904638.1 carbohydrate kinase family protein [Phytohabitans sp. ZYX-F-186]